MAFKGITFAGQNVTPKNDGGLYQAHYGDGILWGCSMSLSGDDLVIQSGEFIMGGRVVQVDGATSVDLSGRTLQTGYIQVIMNADMTQSEGSQWYTSFVESATTTFPALTTDDINDNGDLYQLQLAVVQISGGNLTSIVSPLSVSGLVVNGVSSLGAGAGNPNVWLSEDGVHKGVFFYQGSDQTVRVVAFDNSVGKAGVVFPWNGTSDVRIFNSDGNIVFRPNGASSVNGQLYLDTDGYLLGSKFSHGSITANYQTTVNQGFYVQVGKMCMFQIYCNIASYSANTWTNLSHTSTPLPAPVGQIPRFVAISEGGTQGSITHTGDAQVTAGGIIQVAFPSAYGGVRAVIVNGVYRCG